MDDGTVSARSRSGSGTWDRRRASQRRKTVSGITIRKDDEDVNNHPQTGDTMKFPWTTSPSAPPSPIASASPVALKPSVHKRSLSGSILARLSFLRSPHEDARPALSLDNEPTSPGSSKSRKSIDDDPPVTSPTSPNAESSMAFALMPSKTRKRKGSLRKTALLGGRRIMSETRERRNSLLQRSASNRASLRQSLEDGDDTTRTKAASDNVNQPNGVATPAHPVETVKHAERQFSYESVIAQSSSDSGWSESAAVAATRLALVTEHKSQPSTANSSTAELGSPLDVKSPTSQTSYASTTDDDDPLTFGRPAAASVNINTLPTQVAPGLALSKPHSSAATSYFQSAAVPTANAHAHAQNQRSPLSHTISAATASAHAPAPGLLLLHQPHSYTETEYWGWVILFVTWLTFTVGMGSCLELWSWAWDVGETPYAPPELEDDPTLPIVGYYPALIVLTGVVAWVWITVAWVGMKYFRHAKIEV